MKIKNVVRSTKGLRDALFDEMDALRHGRSNPHVASAQAKLAVQIINSVRLDIEYQKHIQSTPDSKGIGMSINPILLGNAS